MPYEFPDDLPCYFCEYIEGRIPWYPLEESEHAVAFLNVRQRSRGAVLVAPRRHLRSLGALAPREAEELMALVQRAGRAVSRALDPDGLHVFCNGGRLAGQSEAHCHFQVIPRYEGVPYNFKASADFGLTPREEALDLAALIRSAY